MTVKVLIPSGVLGLGFDSGALKRGMDLKPDIICIDGGSTDSGPFYLGTGTSKYARSASKSEWRELMQARAKASIPLIIGSCGTCGTDDAVDWMLDITKELAKELGQSLKIATLYSSQQPETVAGALGDNKITPLAPAPTISDEQILKCSNIVALAGAEQINAAIATGADIILAGRTTDTATISAVPIAQGVKAGTAWHGAKIGECGALCSTHPTSGVIIIEFDDNSFTVKPLAEGATCTPHSVSAHMLYENSDPFVLYEPGGHLDVTQAEYARSSDNGVTVTGSQWIPAENYTVKLEGAMLAGYQSTIMAVLRDSHYVEHAQQWVDRLHPFLMNEIQTRMNLPASEFDLEFRLIGQNAVLGEHETKSGSAVEIGVLGIITASSSEIAEEIGKLINPFVLHYPLTDNEELPTFAFPYSPAQSERGPLYEFSLNHVMELQDPMQAFRLDVHHV